jgi:lipid-A-disaccharide synthase
MSRPLKIAIIAGEESGELLGADLIRSLNAATANQAELIGVGGRHLAELGLTSLFESSEIALMGVSAILRDLPRLIGRIGSTARSIVDAKPDCLVTIDSPEFTLRVARKVHAADPSIPIVHYVCPSVWAWRPGRARDMKGFIDRVLCILPFEVGALQRLDGPPGTYVGHRLTRDPGIVRAAAMQAVPRDLSGDREKTLLLLPGSRRGEVTSLLEPFRDTVSVLSERGHRLRLLLPTVPHVEAMVRQSTASWPQQPEIFSDPDRKWQAFGEADAALIASGTVSLELALAGVPMASCYKLDLFARPLRGLVKSWATLLPNLITDKLVVFEFIDFYVRPPALARQLEALMTDTDMRLWQKAGLADVVERMRTDRPSGDIAAEAVLATIQQRGRP